jgi:hypothetical protein
VYCGLFVELRVLGNTVWSRTVGTERQRERVTEDGESFIGLMTSLMKLYRLNDKPHENI